MGAIDRHEGGAEALDAGKVLIAARLINGALATELGLQGLHRYAIGLYTAIAAALADQFVDDDAPVRVRKLAALAPAALLGRASLVVDQHSAAGHRGELFLHFLELVAMVDFQACWPFGV